MTYKARYTAPILNASVVEYLDTGSGMVSQGTLVRALASKEDTFSLPSDSSTVYPNAYTVRLRFTLPSAQAVDRLVIENIKQVSGLSYTVSRGDGTTMTEIVSSTDIVPVDDYTVANVIVRIGSPLAATTYDIDITGFTQVLQIKGIMIGYEKWVPQFNYEFGATRRDAPVAQHVRAGRGNAVRITDSSRARSLNYTSMPQTDYRSLKNYYINKLVKGYCLFEQTQETEEDWFLAVISLSDFTDPHYDGHNVSVTVKEVNE